METAFAIQPNGHKKHRNKGYFDQNNTVRHNIPNLTHFVAFVKGSVLVWVTDKYSEREARALSAEGARVRRRRNASAASILP